MKKSRRMSRSSNPRPSHNQKTQEKAPKTLSDGLCVDLDALRADSAEHAVHNVAAQKTAQGAPAPTNPVDLPLLDILFSLRIISANQHAAAVIFRNDFIMADMLPHWGPSYEPTRDCGFGYDPFRDKSPAQARAYECWRAAMKAMGEILAPVVESVICHDTVPAPEKVAFVVIGLSKLVVFYGLAGVDTAAGERLDQNVHQTAARERAVRRSGREAAGRGRLLH